MRFLFPKAKVFLDLCLLSLFFFPSVAQPLKNTEHSGKIALVTGASRGIGLSLTQQLLNEGMQVITVARNVEVLQDLKDKFPKKLQIISADLSTKEGQLSVAPAVGNKKVDYLVHNAAIINPLGENALLEANPEEIRNILEVNIVAPMILTNQLASNLKKGSRILLISSRAGDKVVPGLGFYCVTKVAIDRYTNSLKLDMPNGVLAASVHPGDIDTDMQADLRKEDTTHFSKGTFFRQRKDKLTSPEVSGRYLKWLLLETPDEFFVGQKHNIYDASHHSAWSEGEEIPDPFY